MTTDSYSAADIRALTEAGIALTSELSLDTVLQKLVDVTRQQIRARYCALSVLDENGRIERFLTSGISEHDRGRIGHIPEGRGLLGVLLHEGTSLRLDDIATDPRSGGFPANHPPMKTLLGVPLISHGRIIGNLYLTEKEGEERFDDRDEEMVRLLSTQAAVAVENAKLYEQAQRRAREWKALFEVGREVAASPDLRELLQSTVGRAKSLLYADVACLMLLRADNTLEIVAHDGLRRASANLRPVAEHGVQGLAISSGRPLIVRDTAADERLEERPNKLIDEEQLVSVITAPLMGKQGSLGTLMVGTRSPADFGEHEAELLEALTNATAVAIETRRLHDKLESLARLEERERIAMDLHDGVIQKVYATALHLEDLSDRLPDGEQEMRDDMAKAMDDLDQVIKDIRSYIFDLRPKVSQVSDLPLAVRQLVDSLRVNTLMTVELDITEPFRGVGSEAEALALFHIAQEALNNVMKHSRARSARVRLAEERGVSRLEVQDDGVGFELGDEGSGLGQGLRNIADRARSVGAELKIDSAPGRGTRVRVDLRGPNKRKAEGHA